MTNGVQVDFLRVVFRGVRTLREIVDLGKSSLATYHQSRWNLEATVGGPCKNVFHHEFFFSCICLGTFCGANIAALSLPG